MAKKTITTTSGFMKSDVAKMMEQAQSFGVSNIENPFMAAPQVKNVTTKEPGKKWSNDPGINSSSGPALTDMIGSVEMGGVKTGITDLVEIYRQRLQNIRERIATPGRPQATSLFMNRV
jgi:hypothetical protein